ncbi:MAG: SDR family oxidoreductase [Chlamydiales bacterium]|nr:SDR family oxidoreductase [Chlamydiales bacterium]
MLRTIIVTGSSSGIGKTCVEHLLEDGHTVIGISRTTPSFSSCNYHHITCDLSHLDQIDNMVKTITSTHPQVDGLICNAGVGYFGHLEQLSFEHIHEMMDVNFLSHVYLVKHLIGFLKTKQHTDIIFIGSEAALEGKRKGSIYCASKFALRGFAQAIRQECGKSGTRVSMIQPGMTRTSFYDHLNFAPGEDDAHALLPEDIAMAVKMILKMRSSSVCDEIILSPMTHVVQFH